MFPRSPPSNSAALDASGNPGLWTAVIARIVLVPAYSAAFIAAFDDVQVAENITITHVGTAIGAFQDMAFRSDNSPFDQYLRGNQKPMSKSRKRDDAFLLSPAV